MFAGPTHDQYVKADHFSFEWAIQSEDAAHIAMFGSYARREVLDHPEFGSDGFALTLIGNATQLYAAKARLEGLVGIASGSE